MDEKLDRLLAGLPREKASETFTARVLERIHAEERRGPATRPARRRLLLAALPAALALALGLGLWQRQQIREEARARQQSLETLKRETAALEAELEALRRIKAEAGHTLYLGGNEELGVVLDLRRLGAGARPPRELVSARPAIAHPVPEGRIQNAIDPQR